MEVNGYTIEPGADLKGANLKGAWAYSTTIWPKGFDPESAGVIYKDPPWTSYGTVQH